VDVKKVKKVRGKNDQTKRRKSKNEKERE